MVSRAEQAGRRVGENINELANLMYQNNTKKNFFKGVKEAVGKTSSCFTCGKKTGCENYGGESSPCSAHIDEKTII